MATLGMTFHHVNYFEKLSPRVVPPMLLRARRAVGDLDGGSTRRIRASHGHAFAD
jgi:hypothetical protein